MSFCPIGGKQNFWPQWINLLFFPVDFREKNRKRYYANLVESQVSTFLVDIFIRPVKYIAFLISGLLYAKEDSNIRHIPSCSSVVILRLKPRTFY